MFDEPDLSGHPDSVAARFRYFYPPAAAADAV